MQTGYPGWVGWGCFPCRTPQQAEGPGSEPQEARPLVGSPKEGCFRRPRSAMEEGDAGAFPTPGRAPEKESRLLFHPARPVGSLARSARWAHSPSASRLPCCPAPARPAAADTRGPAAPAPSGPAARPVRLARLPRCAARAGLRLMDRPAESFLRGKRRDGTGRGGAGRGRRGGKGPGEEGERRKQGRPEGPSAPPQETAGEAGCRDPPPGC